MVLSRGNTENLATMYANWRGRAPEIKAMLKDRGSRKNSRLAQKRKKAAQWQPRSNQYDAQA